MTIALLKDSPDIPEDLEEFVPQSEYSVNKRGMPIKGDDLESALWLDLCTVVDQADWAVDRV